MQYDGIPSGYVYDDRYDLETNRAMATEQECALWRERRLDHKARRRLLVKLLRERAGMLMALGDPRWIKNYVWCHRVANRIEKGQSDD